MLLQKSKPTLETQEVFCCGFQVVNVSDKAKEKAELKVTDSEKEKTREEKDDTKVREHAPPSEKGREEGDEADKLDKPAEKDVEASKARICQIASLHAVTLHCHLSSLAATARPQSACAAAAPRSRTPANPSHASLAFAEGTWQCGSGDQEEGGG